MKRILAAIDFSPASAAVLQAACSLSSAMGADLELVHVYPCRLPEGPRTYPIGEAEVDRSIAEGERAFRQQLAELAGATKARLVAVHSEDRPGTRICQCARQDHAAVIVAGSHGHGAVYDAIVGSTIRTILRTSPCPVLVVPAHWPKPEPSHEIG